MRLKHIRKIAVLRANALGDFIFILPAIEALRAAYPEAEIVLLDRNCMDDNCDHTPSFVADISVEEVSTAALELLALPISPCD